jgi:hypothetical protein
MVIGCHAASGPDQKFAGTCRRTRCPEGKAHTRTFEDWKLGALDTGHKETATLG